jgi:hypothetical protein
LLVENLFFRNSKDLLDILSSTSQYVGSRIKTFNFSTLYIFEELHFINEINKTE